MISVVIVGGGVIGLTSAIRIQERFFNSVKITIITDKESPDTTGDGAAGLWGPYLLQNTSDDLICKWSKATHQYFLQLWRSGLANTAGVCLQPCLRVLNDVPTKQLPTWSQNVFGIQVLTEEQLKKINNDLGTSYKHAKHFVTFSCESTKFLPYLTSRFIEHGGVLERRQIKCLKRLARDYDVLINCSGFGARELANDADVHSIRGQIAMTKAPWIFSTFIDDSDDGLYIIPNTNQVILGGTHQVNDEDVNVRLSDSEGIIKGCHKLIPSLQKGKMIREWVGLRPGRDSVRLELEYVKIANGRSVPVIHNYGHGGAGITLSWGCAIDVTNLFSTALKHLQTSPQSHL